MLYILYIYIYIYKYTKYKNIYITKIKTYFLRKEKQLKFKSLTTMNKINNK